MLPLIMSTLANLTVAQLKQALAIQERIETLERELNEISGEEVPTVPNPSPAGRRTMSPAARANIAAAQRARWAKQRGVESAVAPKKRKRRVSAAARAALSAAAKARGAEIKGAPVAAPKKPKRKFSAAVRAARSAAAKARWKKAKASGKNSL